MFSVRQVWGGYDVAALFDALGDVVDERDVVWICDIDEVEDNIAGEIEEIVCCVGEVGVVR